MSRRFVCIPPPRHNHMDMKKNLTLVLVASLCLAAIPGCGDKKEEEGKPSAPAEAAAMPTSHVGVAKAMLATLDKLTAVLASVTDRASADAAAAKLPAILAEMRGNTEAMAKLGEPTDEVEAALHAMEPEGNARMGAMMEKLMPLAAKQYYGSEALRKVLEEKN